VKDDAYRGTRARGLSTLDDPGREDFPRLSLLTERDSSRDFRSPPSVQPGGRDFKAIPCPHRLNDQPQRKEEVIAPPGPVNNVHWNPELRGVYPFREVARLCLAWALCWQSPRHPPWGGAGTLKPGANHTFSCAQPAFLQASSAECPLRGWAWLVGSRWKKRSFEYR
jgi:hypothetical protein